MDLNKLYDYQKETAENLAERYFGADLSEVGTGKTVTAMGVMHLSGENSFLVISPKSVARQWENKFHEFWPSIMVFGSSVSQDQRIQTYKDFFNFDGRKVLVVTYEHIRMDIYWLKDLDFGVIYADECHRLGNPKTLLYKAITKLKIARRYGATATPLRSSPLQAYGIFNWLNPGLLGKSYYHFLLEYTVKNNQGWILGYKNLDKLGQKIFPHYVKNTMEDVGVFLPKLIEESIEFELNKREQKLYDNMRKEMLLEIEEKEIKKINDPTALYLSVVKLGKMQEVCDSLEMLGDYTDSSKIATLKGHLKDTLESGNKAVVFTRFSRMAHILYRELSEYSPALIVGDTKDRQAEIDKFDNDEDCKVIVITTAGNEGINLQRANILYMVDVPLGSYGSLVQTIGRINRIGQTKPMVVYYLMAKDTVDVRLKKLLMLKKDMSEKIFNNWGDIKGMLE